MNHTIHIEANNSPIILERLMSVTRIRGFSLKHIEIHKASDKSFHIRMTVGSQHAIEKLTNQLNKVRGIKHLTALHGVETSIPTGSFEPHKPSANERCNQLVIG